jgi:hypothetical protein
VHWLEGLEGKQWNRELLEGLDLILVSEYQPEEACQVEDLRWVVEEQFLVPVRMPCVLHQH